MGAVMPEALAAWEELRADIPGLGLLSVTSPDLLHRGWTDGAGGALGRPSASPAMSRALLSALAPGAGPRHHRRRRAGLAFVARRRARPARRTAWGRPFGQTGSLPTSMPPTGWTAQAITEAVAELLLPA